MKKNQSRELEPLVAAAKRRTQAVAEKLRKAMRTIEAEIERADGLYPFNGGRLTQAEVCRRAGVSKVTLQGAAHKTTTRVELEAWLKCATLALKTGKRTVRRAVTDRADAWKA